jgi:hypothetical protein
MVLLEGGMVEPLRIEVKRKLGHWGYALEGVFGSPALSLTLSLSLFLSLSLCFVAAMK